MIRPFFLGAFTALMLISVSASADVSAKINSWFTNMNYANVTQPGVYEGQSARYATFGGVSARAPITQPFNFVNIQTPRFSAGCGGIDLYTGGFSAIDADEFVQNLRAIGQNAQSLAFMLAIQIVSPQLSGVMEDINAFASKYLQYSMDSCEAATALVGGAMDMMGAQESNCTIKRMQDSGEDWHTANAWCTTREGPRPTENSGSTPNVIEFVKGNVAWTALMQDAFFRSDLQFSEVMMNLTGTLIVSDADTTPDSASRIAILEPALGRGITKERFNNIYNAMLFGTDAIDPLKYYNCTENRTTDKDGCTQINGSLQDLAVSWDGLYKRVDTLVDGIVTNIRNDQPLSAPMVGLVSSTSFPLYRYLSVSAAYFDSGFNITRMTGDYTKLIASDILLRALQAVVERVEQSASMISGGLSDSKRIREYREDLASVLAELEDREKSNAMDAEQLYYLNERMVQYEKALMTKLGSGIMASAMWGQ